MRIAFRIRSGQQLDHIDDWTCGALQIRGVMLRAQGGNEQGIAIKYDIGRGDSQALPDYVGTLPEYRAGNGRRRRGI